MLHWELKDRISRLTHSKLQKMPSRNMQGSAGDKTILHRLPVSQQRLTWQWNQLKILSQNYKSGEIDLSSWEGENSRQKMDHHGKRLLASWPSCHEIIPPSRQPKLGTRKDPPGGLTTPATEFRLFYKNMGLTPHTHELNFTSGLSLTRVTNWPLLPDEASAPRWIYKIFIRYAKKKKLGDFVFSCRKHRPIPSWDQE